jgi:glycosyltransferase involved in cell wall biosynthesis
MEKELKVFKRIGIDCRMSEESGIGRYITNLVMELSKIDLDNEYILFILDNSNLLKLNLPKNYKFVNANFKWHTFSEQFPFLGMILKQKLDIYHSPHSNMPFFYFRPFILTVHDLTIIKHRTGRASTLFYPLYLLKLTIFKFFLCISIKRAAQIITVSDYVKREIVNEFKIDENKVHTAYNGVNLTISRKNPNECSNVLDKFSLQNKPFIFYVGNAYPHKNLETLISAFSLLNIENKYSLVLAGKSDFFYERLKKEYQNSQKIKFIGGVTDEELSCLYSLCDLFVYPSISEGFGLQILEALYCKCRIACSGNTSFPEIAGNLVSYFNPFDINSMIKTMSQALVFDKDRISDEEIEKIVNKFSWKNSAKIHLEIYEKN